MKLGELSVNRVGLGAMRVIDNGSIWGEPSDRAKALKVLRRALELGVNFFDTAESYGPHTSEILIAEALHPYPKGFVIGDRKSTRLNSSHTVISYAVFCLKKKK